MKLHDDYTLAQIEAMPTIHSGQYDNLKIEEYGECDRPSDAGIGATRSRGCRVWLSRMTVEDGAECNNLVTVERIINGRWETVMEYQAGETA